MQRESNGPGKHIGHYQVGYEVGSGASASVWQGLDEITRTDVAIKIINKSIIVDQKGITQFQREISILKTVNHPLIAEFYEVLEDEDHFYIIMEWAPRGNLLDRVNSFGRYSEDNARLLFAQLISAIEYLHMYCHIAHRDLKCENVLLDCNNNLKLIDFGLSNSFSSQIPYLNTACGSPAYASPEVIKGGKYTQSTDIWSLGVILYAIVVGKLPFDDSDMNRILEKVCYSDVDYPIELSTPLVDLLQRMLTKDPALRISLSKIKEHPWFSLSDFNLIENQMKKCGLITHIGHSDRDIDREIISRMIKIGVRTDGIMNSLLLSDFNENVAVYRMLRRMKDNAKVEEITQALHENTPGGIWSSSPKMVGFDVSKCQGNTWTHKDCKNIQLKSMFKAKTAIPNPAVPGTCPGQFNFKKLTRPNFNIMNAIGKPTSIRRGSKS